MQTTTALLLIMTNLEVTNMDCRKNIISIWGAGSWRLVIAALMTVWVSAHLVLLNPVDAQTAETGVHPNDVSILYPLPETVDEASALISVAHLTSIIDNTFVLPEGDFFRIMSLAKSHGKVGNRTIGFLSQIESIDAWKIAGIRFDPSAPGASSQVKTAFGSVPQIRLILQPVTLTGTQATVHDVAIHAIYNFILPPDPNNPQLRMADEPRVTDIIEHLIELREVCNEQGEQTSGALSIHPCLKEPASDFHLELVDFLRTHLHASKFQVAAIMGLNGGAFEPWIFVALQRQPDGVFQAFPSPGLGAITADSVPPTAQMISFLDRPRVQPKPSSTNTLPISANLGIQAADRRGVSTEPLFNSVDLSAAAQIGVTSSGEEIRSDELSNADIVDWVANPEKAHFFNTDCVSCHTETTRRQALNIAPSDVRFIPKNAALTVDSSLQHSNQWNVRNFGWFVDPRFGSKQTTITQRTANETFEVVEAINELLLEQND